VASIEPQIAGLAGRYASAVFELALEEKALDVLERDLATLKALLAASEDLVRLVRSPAFSADEQAKGMNAVLDAAGGHALTRRLVLLLARKRRLFALNDVIRAFEAIVARHRGEVSAEVISARPLNDSETTELKRALKAKLGREPKLAASVDPKLLGGLVVKIGSRMIDSSLRTKLDGLRAAMRGA